MSDPEQIVYKVEEDMDPEDILCTTYQMRNMYSQLGTGYFTALDVMNYIQHHAAIEYLKSGDRVLDVCCGRGLLLPLLKYHKPNISHYIGVDIEPKNQREAYRRAGTASLVDKRFALNSEGSGDSFYPFAVTFIEGNVTEMSSKIQMEGIKTVDHIVYTASIEHMQKNAGIQSLIECHELLKSDGTMFLSTPNTHGDPYDTQYAAHLYEWSREELLEVTEQLGFELIAEFGLFAKVRGYEELLEEYYPEEAKLFHKLKQYLPKEWLYSIVPILTPNIADEIVLILRKKN